MTGAALKANAARGCCTAMGHSLEGRLLDDAVLEGQRTETARQSKLKSAVRRLEAN